MSRETAEVAIVGGGLVGAATAYFLSGEGVDCVVVERDGIASHASGFSYPESTEGGRGVSVLKRRKGAPVHLG